MNRGEGASPAPDLELEGFKKRYRHAYDREIAPVKAELQAGLAVAAEGGKEWFRARLDFLKTLRLGGKPPVAPAKSGKPVAKAAVKAAPLSREELLEGGRYLLGRKQAHKLTKAQRAVLQEVGEL